MNPNDSKKTALEAEMKKRGMGSSGGPVTDPNSNRRAALEKEMVKRGLGSFDTSKTKKKGLLGETFDVMLRKPFNYGVDSLKRTAGYIGNDLKDIVPSAAESFDRSGGDPLAANMQFASKALGAAGNVLPNIAAGYFPETARKVREGLGGALGPMIQGATDIYDEKVLQNIEDPAQRERARVAPGLVLNTAGAVAEFGGLSKLPGQLKKAGTALDDGADAVRGRLNKIGPDGPGGGGGGPPPPPDFVAGQSLVDMFGPIRSLPQEQQRFGTKGRRPGDKLIAAQSPTYGSAELMEEAVSSIRKYSSEEMPTGVPFNGNTFAQAAPIAIKNMANSTDRILQQSGIHLSGADEFHNILKATGDTITNNPTKYGIEASRAYENVLKEWEFIDSYAFSVDGSGVSIFGLKELQRRVRQLRQESGGFKTNSGKGPNAVADVYKMVDDALSGKIMTLLTEQSPDLAKAYSSINKSASSVLTLGDHLYEALADYARSKGIDFEGAFNDRSLVWGLTSGSPMYAGVIIGSKVMQDLITGFFKRLKMDKALGSIGRQADLESSIAPGIKAAEMVVPVQAATGKLRGYLGKNEPGSTQYQKLQENVMNQQKARQQFDESEAMKKQGEDAFKQRNLQMKNQQVDAKQQALADKKVADDAKKVADQEKIMRQQQDDQVKRAAEQDKLVQKQQALAEKALLDKQKLDTAKEMDKMKLEKAKLKHEADLKAIKEKEKAAAAAAALKAKGKAKGKLGPIKKPAKAPAKKPTGKTKK